VPMVNNQVAQQKQATSEALKVIISNLPFDVEEDSVRVSRDANLLLLVALADGGCFVQELMITTVGPIKVVELSYDSKGKSKGIATVIFKQKGSAQKAFEQCTSLSFRWGIAFVRDIEIGKLIALLSEKDNNRMIDQS